MQVKYIELTHLSLQTPLHCQTPLPQVHAFRLMSMLGSFGCQMHAPPRLTGKLPSSRPGPCR